MNEELELYKERLNKFLDLLINNDLKPFLLCGTLLAFIREGQPFSHDYKDIDIALPKKDYWKVRQILDTQTEFTYYRVWRSEIAVYYKERKIDIFFLEDDNKNNLYIYSYKLNSFTGKYDTEWRTRFQTSDFYPLKTINYEFLNREVFVPNNPEAILTTHYGEWKIPNTKWSINDMTNVDKNYRQIAFIIPTFLRPEKIKNCIQTIYKIFPRDWHRIYVGNQDNSKRYDYLHSDDKFYNLEYNVGIAKTRQLLIDSATEPFVVIIDDDFLLTKETNLNAFIQVLLDKESNGIVGGQLKNYNSKPLMSYLYNLEYKKASLKKVEIKPIFKPSFVSKSQTSIPYAYGDLILNFYMAKRELFNDVVHDHEFKLVEHLDFFLRLKLFNKWKVCFVENVFAEHQNEENSEQYNNYRNWKTGENVLIGYQRFRDKWGIELRDIEVIKLEQTNGK